MYEYRDNEGRTFDDENASVAGFIVKTMNQNHEIIFESEMRKTASEAKERADTLRRMPRVLEKNEYVVTERIDRVICYDKQNVWIDANKIGVTTFKRKKIIRSVGNLEYNIGGGILGTVLFHLRRIKVSWIPAFNRWQALYDEANPPDLDAIHASLGGLMYLNSTEPRLRSPHITPKGDQEWLEHSTDSEDLKPIIEGMPSANWQKVTDGESRSSDTLTTGGNTPETSGGKPSTEKLQETTTSSSIILIGTVDEPGKAMISGKPSTPINSIRIKAFRPPQSLSNALHH